MPRATRTPSFSTPTSGYGNLGSSSILPTSKKMLQSQLLTRLSGLTRIDRQEPWGGISNRDIERRQFQPGHWGCISTLRAWGLDKETKSHTHNSATQAHWYSTGSFLHPSEASTSYPLPFGLAGLPFAAPPLLALLTLLA